MNIVVKVIFTVSLVLMCIFIKVLKAKNKKLLGSFSFQLIDDEYLKWYQKNSYILNNRHASMYEIDNSIYTLKVILENRGISTSMVQDYIRYLEMLSSSKKSTILKLLSGVFSFFVSSGLFKFFLLKDLSDNPITSLEQTWLSWLKYLQLDNLETLFSIKDLIPLINYLMVYYIQFHLFYFAIFGRSMGKNSRRLFVLKRLAEIWNYTTSNEFIQINKPIKENLIFINAKVSPSKIDSLISNAVGADYMRENISVFLNIIKLGIFRLNIFNLNIPRLKNILNFFKGLCGPLCIILFLDLFLIVSQSIFIKSSIFIKFSYFRPVAQIIHFIFQLIIAIVYYFLYVSQIDMLSKKEKPKSKIEEKKKYTYGIKVRQSPFKKSPLFFTLILTLGELMTYIFFIFPKFSIDFSCSPPIKLITILSFIIPLIVAILINIFGFFIEQEKREQT